MLAAALASIALLPGLLTATVDRGQAADAAPDPAPEQLHSDFDPLYPSGAATGGATRSASAGAPDCGGANACFAADFSGEKGGKPYGTGKATLAKGRHGRYQPLSCGASCSPPSIAWKERGVTYTIQAEGRRQAERPRAAGEDGQRGDQAGTALSDASRSARGCVSRPRARRRSARRPAGPGSARRRRRGAARRAGACPRRACG